MARLIADLPKLKAAVETGDPPTVRAASPSDYRRQLGADCCVVTDRRRCRCWPSADWRGAVAEPAAGRAPRRSTGTRRAAFWPHPDGVLQVVTRADRHRRRPARDPRHAERRLPARRRRAAQIQGAHRQRDRLRLGRARPRPRRCRRRSRDALAAARVGSRGHRTRALGGEEYSSVAGASAGTRRRTAPGAAEPGGARPALAHRAPALPRRIHTRARRHALLAVLLATLLSYAVARTITRPLGHDHGHHARDGRDGDLTRKIAAPRPRMGRRGRAAAGHDVQHADRRRSRASSAKPPSASGCRRSAACRRSSRTKSATR